MKKKTRKKIQTKKQDNAYFIIFKNRPQYTFALHIYNNKCESPYWLFSVFYPSENYVNNLDYENNSIHDARPYYIHICSCF